MEEAQEMMMVPTSATGQQQTSITNPTEGKRGPGRPRHKETDEFSKLARAINIAFKLYSVGEIGDELELLGPGGVPVPNVDLISLINYALSRGRARIGEETFIKALAKARIPLSWISNEDIRIKVQNANIAPLSKKRKLPSDLPEEEYGDAPTSKRSRIIINETSNDHDEIQPSAQPLPDDNEDDIMEEEETQPSTLKTNNHLKPPIKIRMRKRPTPYRTRNPNWEVIQDE